MDLRQDERLARLEVRLHSSPPFLRLMQPCVCGVNRYFKTHATVADLPGRAGAAKPKVFIPTRPQRALSLSNYLSAALRAASTR